MVTGLKNTEEFGGKEVERQGGRVAEFLKTQGSELEKEFMGSVGSQ